MGAAARVDALRAPAPGAGQFFDRAIETNLRVAGRNDDLPIAPHHLGPQQRSMQARQVAHLLKAMVGIGMQAVVKRPGEIRRSEGKAVRVCDLRPGQRV